MTKENLTMKLKVNDLLLTDKIMKKLFFLGSLLWIGCNSNTILPKPDNFIEHDEMVVLMADIYCAKAASNYQTKTGERNINYENSVYQKHQVTKEDFLNSLRYYQSTIDDNEKLLTAVDAEITNRLKKLP